MLHHYCLFYKNNKLHFGWIQELKKNKLLVVPKQGKAFNCSPKQTEYIWEGQFFPDAKEAIPYLSKKASWVHQEVSNIDIPTIHELCEVGLGYTLDHLALDFLEEPEDGWSKVALLFALKNNSILFQQKKSEFHARSPEEIEKVKEQKKKRAEKEKQHIREQEWANALLNNQLPERPDSEIHLWDHFVRRLVNFVVHLNLSSEKEYFRSLFHCDIKEPVVTESLIINCLNVAGVPISWGKVLLERSSAELEFAKNEIESSEQLATQDIWKSPFNCEIRDHRQKLVYTVDNPETRDLDDAIGWEETESGTILRIYISDVASFITPDHPLFKCAEKRISSIYTIKEVFPMLPSVLSENVFSLIENQDRAVMAFEININEEGENAFSIYRAIINVGKNLSYNDVDQLIGNQEGHWTQLWDFCLALKEQRIDNGSLEMDRIEVKLDIADPDQIVIASIRENTPATIIIEEIAIYTNYLAAKYCRENELRALYRNQAPYSMNKGLEEGVKPRLKDVYIQPAHIDLIPKGHSALGLECYMQVTSPIRRYSDLINQSIIFANLADQDSAFSTDDLCLWSKRVGDTQREYLQLERALLDHWKIKYLSQNKDKIYEAQFVRYLKNRKALLNILEVQLYTEALIDGLREDEELEVIIESIKPEYNQITLRRGSQHAEE